MKEKRRSDRSEGVNCTDGKIDAARDDHNCSPDRHDGDEAGIFGELGEALRVEEFIFFFEGRFAIPVAGLDEYSFQFARRIGFEDGHFYFAAEDRQKSPENQNYYNQTSFLKAKLLAGQAR